MDCLILARQALALARQGHRVEEKRGQYKVAIRPPRYRYHGGQWSATLAAYIWNRDKGHCVYCGASGQQIDHVVPSSKGGPSIKGNGVLSCRACNARKSNRFPMDMLIRAFVQLLSEGEDITWLEELWRESA